MSDTPRTDAFCEEPDVVFSRQWIDFARQLEKELAAKSDEALAMAERLKALESQGNTLCGALETVSLFTERLPNLLPTPEMRTAAAKVQENLRKILTEGRALFPK